MIDGENLIQRVHMIDLDVYVRQSYGENLEQVCEELTVGLPVTLHVLTEDGPSGHPLVRFTGARDDLVELLRRYNAADLMV